MPRDDFPSRGGGPSEAELRQELKHLYDTLAAVTSRLLLVNEAAEAGLDCRDRTGLCGRFLEVTARGLEVRQGAVFLVEGNGFAVGATTGLSDEEAEALTLSEADIEACGVAVGRRAPLLVDPELAEEPVRKDMAAGGSEEGEAEGSRGETADRAPERGDEAEGEEADEEGDEGESEGDDEDEDEESAAGAGEGAGRAAMFGLYLPVEHDEKPAAVLALGGRMGGQLYAEEDMAFLDHLLRQFAVALSRSALMEENAERLEELNALLKVSREITSTLDLDGVLRAVVNTVSAVIENDRAEIALLRGGRLVLRTVSGMTRLDADQAEILKLERPLEYLRLNPMRLQFGAADLDEGSSIPGADVFREYFESQEMSSFMALPLRDDQGLLGVLCIESRQDAWSIEPAEGDTLDILGAQATVAIRNAGLYSQIPLRGVTLPFSRIRSRIGALASRARVGVAVTAAAGLLGILLPVFPERAGGPAEVKPLRIQGARASSPGVVSRVLIRGGEDVRAGQVLAEIEDLDLAEHMAQLEGAVDIARRGVAKARLEGDAVLWRSGQIQLEALERRLSVERQRAARTVLTAPLDGQVLELDLGRRVGEHLGAGESFCTVAAVDVMAADLLVSEQRVGRVGPGQPVSLKVTAFPTRTFRGRVAEVGWQGQPDEAGTMRFVVRAAIENADGHLRPGMRGIGKASVGRRSLAALALEPLARAVWMAWW